MTSVLPILKKNRGEKVSARHLVDTLGISRTAVWKQIRALKKYGYEISSAQHGYTLLKEPGLLLPEEIHYGLETEDFGKKIVYFPSIDSTNDYAKKSAAQGAFHGTAVVAEEQRRGKGRLGRHWFSPREKNIYLSLILRPSLVPQEAYKLTMLTGVSVVEAIQKEVGVPALLKWPNDVVVKTAKGFAKVGGILTEMSAESDRINFAVLGIGLNVNMSEDEWPSELRGVALSIKEAAQSQNDLARVKIVQEILRRLEGNYRFLEKKWDAIYKKYCSLDIVKGRTISVQQGQELWTGKVMSIGRDGTLVLKTRPGMQKIVAGEVMILK